MPIDAVEPIVGRGDAAHGRLQARELPAETLLGVVWDGDDAGDEFDKVSLVPPDRLVVDRHLVDIGDRGVELTHVRRGHTSNDLVVVVSDGGVVFAGDLLEQAGPSVLR